jgi:hypothetical protein
MQNTTLDENVCGFSFFFMGERGGGCYVFCFVVVVIFTFVVGFLYCIDKNIDYLAHTTRFWTNLHQVPLAMGVLFHVPVFHEDNINKHLGQLYVHVLRLVQCTCVLCLKV